MTAVISFTTSSLISLVALLIGAVGTIALGWSIFRSQALSAWRAAAEGYKAQNDELSGRLERAEQNTASLQQQIAKLESLPDMTAVMDKLESIAQAVDRVGGRGEGHRRSHD